MHYKNSIAAALKWSFSGKLIIQLISWSVTLYVLHNLKAEEYGLFAILTLFVSLILMVGESGIQSVIIKSQSEDKTFLRTVLGFSLAIHIGISILIFSISYPVASFYRNLQLENLIQVLSLNAFIISFSHIPLALLLKSMKIKVYTKIKMSCSLVLALSLFVFVSQGYGVWSLVWSQLISNTVLAVYANKESYFLHYPIFNLSCLKKELNFCYHLIVQRWLLFFTNFFDVFIIGKFLGLKQLGAYSVANNLSQLPRYFLLQSFNHLTFPAISREQGSIAETETKILKALRVIAFIIFPISFGFSAIAEELIIAIFVGKWNESIIPLMLISLSIPFKTLFVTITEILNALGHHKQTSKLQTAMLITCAASVSIGATFGIIEAAFAVMMSTLFNTILTAIFLNNCLLISYKRLILIITGPFICSSVMFTCLYLIPMNELTDLVRVYLNPSLPSGKYFSLILSIILGGIIYAVSSMFFCKDSIKNLVTILKNS